jgi:hypothetical protein
LTNVALAIVIFLLKCICYILVKIDHDSRHVTERKRKMGKNNRYHKERGIRIVDPRRIDYTYTYTDDQGMFDIKSPSDEGKNKDDSKKSKTEKDTQQLRYDPTMNTKIRTKGRITGGQSKQGHSSVYE